MGAGWTGFRKLTRQTSFLFAYKLADRYARMNGLRKIKIWDVTTKQEILALDEHQGPLKGLAFSPDGRQIAAAGQDGTVQIWDAAPLTPERRTLREARSVVEFLSAQKLPAAEIKARIQRDPTISDEVRTRALALEDHVPERAAE